MQRILFSNARSNEVTEIDSVRKGSWIQLIEPSKGEVERFAKAYNLNQDLLLDGLDLYESPRVERDGENIYVFVRFYHPNNGVINATEPMLLVYTPEHLITLTRRNNAVIEKMSQTDSGAITTQKTKLLLQILSSINDTYFTYVTSVTRRIFQVRSQLRETRVSEQSLLDFVVLEDDLNEFLSALQPQAAVLRLLLTGKYMQLFEDDKDLIEDISLNNTEIVELVKSRLKTIIIIRESYDAIAASELNRTFKRLTSISIFLMLPTVVSGIYGMNVRLPFANSAGAFSVLMAIVFISTLLTVFYFRHRKWL